MRRPPMAPTAAPFTIQQLFGIVRRRMWLIIMVTVFFTIGGAALWYVLRKYSPEFTSKGMVRCKMPQQENVLQGIASNPRKEIITLETQGQSLYLTNETFLGRILTDRDVVKQTQWYLKRKDKPDILKDLKNAFQATPHRDSDLVVVTMRAGNKEEARKILDEILMQFRQDMDKRATAELRDKVAALNKQNEQIDQTILRKRDQLSALSTKVNVPGWEQNRTVTMDEVEMTQREKMRLDAQINELLAQARRIEEDRRILGYSSRVNNAVQNDPMIVGLRNQLSNLQMHLSQVLGRLGEDHQRVKAIHSAIASVEAELQQRQGQLQRQYSESEQRVIQNEILTLQQQYEKISEQYESVAARQNDLDRQRASYDIIQQELLEFSRKKEQVESRITAINVMLDNPDRVRAEVAAWGDLPIEISFPRLAVFGPGGLLIGLLFSGLIIFLLEFFDDSIKTPSDVNRYIEQPLLGMIPFYDEQEDGKETVLALVAHSHPQAMISEAYRQVRTNLFFSAPINELKTLFITSSVAGCGKTTTAVNLAITLAAEGKRILLVDANFRRALLNRLFVMEGPPRGLSNVLVGQVPAAEVIHASGYEGLDIVDAGPVPPNPSVLLGSERMKKFLESQKQYYDHIIVDGPPVLVVTDARILARQADGTIALIKAGKTSRGIVQRMVRELKNNKVNLLGVLLNEVRPRKGGYFHKAYRSYYDYISYDSNPVGALPVGALPVPTDEVSNK